MPHTKKADQTHWSDFLRTFINGNKGRLISIEVAVASIGDQPLADSVPLFAIDYGSAGKGNDPVITAGRDEIDDTHKIDAPVEIWES